MDSLQDDDELSEMWRNSPGKWYKKVLILVYGLVFLIVLWIVFSFLVALYLEAGRAELGYNGDTHIEEKRGWWE